VISDKVGQGGISLKKDVLIIQQALNAVAEARGGPVPRLATDGLIGPKTRAAIGKFQKKNISFVDFRIDPNGPTIKALNAVLGSVTSALTASPTFTVTDEQMERVFSDIVPIAQACVKAARRALGVARVMGTIESPSQTLLRKHFAVVASDPPPPDFVLIEGIFRDIDRQLSLAKVIPEQIFIKFPFTFSFAELAEDRTLALALSNGVKDRGQVVKLDRTDGTSATLRADAVVLTPTYFIATSDLQIGTLIHELAHFVGKTDGDPDCIEDPPGRSSSDAALARLSAQQRPRIAELYAMFAFEAHFGRPMFRSLLDLNFP
jgi:peptidoglycan hydrolase-like protein with peptidoglycan-binding domain